VSGWHVQQVLKIAGAIELPHQRYCILDSDIVFFRDFDLSGLDDPNSVPLLRVADRVTLKQTRHARWVETAHQLLGLSRPQLPAFDFIGHIIFWDRQAIRAMVARIEEVTGRDWIEALCKTREFSEYMLYGYFVQNDAKFSGMHTPSPHTCCVSYWDHLKLDRSELNRLLGEADEKDVAFSAASFSGTPVEMIRAAIEETRHLRRPPAGKYARA